MVCCIFIGLEFHYNPYAWRLLQNLERVSLGTLTISLLLASLFQSNSFRSSGRRWIVEVSIAFVNSVFIVYFMVILLYKYRHKYKHCNCKKKANLPEDIYDRRDSISFINPLHQNMKEKSVVTNINKKKGNEHGIDIHNGDIEMTLPTLRKPKKVVVTNYKK